MVRTLSNPVHEGSSDSLGVHHQTVDEPSPTTVPLYLRSVAAAAIAEPVEPLPALEARTRILTAQSTAIVDSMTRGLAEALAVSLRPFIASTVVALLPMILSLGSIPEDEWPEAARPSRSASAPT